jgi:hypothetical protein
VLRPVLDDDVPGLQQLGLSARESERHGAGNHDDEVDRLGGVEADRVGASRLFGRREGPPDDLHPGTPDLGEHQGGVLHRFGAIVGHGRNLVPAPEMECFPTRLRLDEVEGRVVGEYLGVTDAPGHDPGELPVRRGG